MNNRYLFELLKRELFYNLFEYIKFFFVVMEFIERGILFLFFKDFLIFNLKFNIKWLKKKINYIK